MTLLISMLPLYLLGNLHCLGMCGPLVFFLGKHPYRHFYFLGRTLSYSLAGFIAGGLGSVLSVTLQTYHLAALISFLFGGVILWTGWSMAFGKKMALNGWLAKRFEWAGNSLSLLLLREKPLPAFLFGFFTLFLPCGQTLIVFSACALSQDASIGLLNGFAFAVLTSPSLWLAMDTRGYLQKWRGRGNQWVGFCALGAGMIAILRGLADLEWIPHFIISSQENLHIALY